MVHPICTRTPSVFDETMDENNNTPDDMTEQQDTPGDEPNSFSDSDENEDAFVDDGASTAPPPHFSSVPVEDRLVRDPNATFGGVLSGIAHRYGWDVAITRLAFIVIGFMTGGTALAAYFLGWLIIPRAMAWPPVRSTGRFSRPGGLSGRDIGIGLLGLAALVALAIGSGEAAAIVVPIALIAAGVWMLMQNPRPEAAQVVAAPSSSSAPVYGVPLGEAAPAQPAPPFVPVPPVAQQPVVPRSRGRRAAKFGLFGFIALALLALIAVPLIAFAVIFNGEIDFDTTSRRVIVENEVPAVISQDVGELFVDLRDADFPADATEPQTLLVSVDAGEITVILPEDISVQVDASADVGDVTVFGQSEDGIDPEIMVDESDPQLILEVALDVGEIEVIRDDDVVRGEGADLQERS